MKRYADDNAAFFLSWCRQYREMSLLGVDPGPAGFKVNDGWVRGGLHLTRCWPLPIIFDFHTSETLEP